MRNSRKGFTLAEVLVTLAIIGVVAALTIPTLIQSTNNSKYATTLKKTISVLNQAMMSQGADGATLSTTTVYTDDTLADFFAAKLNVIKQNATGVLWLADGTKLAFSPMAAGCGTTLADPFLLAATACYVIVDVNGDKGPNTVTVANATGSITTAGDVYVLGITTSSVSAVNAQTAIPLLALSKFGTLTAGGATLDPAYVDDAVPLGASIAAITQ